MSPTHHGADCPESAGCPTARACSPKFIPCITIGRVHDEKASLCNILESIADKLPNSVDRLQCLAVASSLVPLLRECHRFEEETVFRAFAVSDANAAIVERLKSEHVEDDCAAQELTETLLAIGHGREIQNPEALGYMLRGFFESMRRHLAFERDHLLPLVLARAAGAPRED